MPTYRYRCTSCSYEFEEFQSMHDDPLKQCPKCTKKIIRIIQSVGIQFKGSGFYVNDSNSSSSVKSNNE